MTSGPEDPKKGREKEGGLDIKVFSTSHVFYELDIISITWM